MGGGKLAALTPHRPNATDLESIPDHRRRVPLSSARPANSTIAGTQACRGRCVRKGYRVILVNSNPATIMTDPEFA